MLTIDPEFRRLIPALRPEELSALEASLLAEGCRDALITWQGILLDGHNRYDLCELHGILYATTELEFDTRADAMIWALANQGARRNLTDDQRAFLAEDLRVRLSERAVSDRGKRARAAVKARNPTADASRTPGDTSEDELPPEAGAPKPKQDTRKEAAAAFAVPRRKLTDARRLEETRPDLAAKARAGEISIREAKAEARAESKAATAAKIKAEPTPTPKGPFRVIVADVPWPYESRLEDITHRGTMPYPPMSIEAICALEVEAMAHEDAILFFWTTNAFMRDSYQVLDAWGFQEKTIITWKKPSMGLGNWVRNITEHCIVAVRGRPTVTLTNQTTLLEGPVREHSRKPEKFYELVESLCPGSKLELFARQPREGWSRWGAESEKFGE